MLKSFWKTCKCFDVNIVYKSSCHHIVTMARWGSCVCCPYTWGCDLNNGCMSVIGNFQERLQVRLSLMSIFILNKENTIKISWKPALLTSGKIHNRAINCGSETKYSDVLVFWWSSWLMLTGPELGLGIIWAKYDCQMILSIHQRKLFNMNLPQLAADSYQAHWVRATWPE